MLEPDLEMISSDSDDVRAGMQGNVRLLIYHSSFIFLTPNIPSSLKQKVSVVSLVGFLFVLRLPPAGVSSSGDLGSV